MQREVELYPPDISMMEKVPKQNSIENSPLPFQNYYPVNAQLENTGKILVTLQRKPPLHYVVYPISEANSSTASNFLMRFKQNR